MFQLLLISNVIYYYGLPDRGTRLERKCNIGIENKKEKFVKDVGDAENVFGRQLLASPMSGRPC
jgi:hypothetical protein